MQLSEEKPLAGRGAGLGNGFDWDRFWVRSEISRCIFLIELRAKMGSFRQNCSESAELYTRVSWQRVFSSGFIARGRQHDERDAAKCRKTGAFSFRSGGYRRVEVLVGGGSDICG